MNTGYAKMICLEEYKYSSFVVCEGSCHPVNHLVTELVNLVVGGFTALNFPRTLTAENCMNIHPRRCYEAILGFMSKIMLGLSC